MENKYKVVMYTNVHIIVGDASVPMIEDGCILVDNQGIIRYVGGKEDVPNAHVVKKVDCQGGYVTPGLINAHAHFFNSGDPMNQFPELLVKFVTWILKTSIGKQILKLEYKQNFRTAINAGITTVRDMGSFYYYDVRYKHKNKRRPTDKKRKLLFPRIIASGSMITATGGHGCLYPDCCISDDPWTTRKKVRENISHQVDWIKICCTEGVSDAEFIGEAGKVSMTRQEIEAACEEAHSRNKLIATHCESTEGLRRALLAGVDTIEHGAPIPDDLIELFKHNPNSLRGYTALIPTLSAFFIPDLDKKLKNTEENHIIIENTRIIGDGVKTGLITAYNNDIVIGVGSDASVPRVTHYDLYKELGYIKEFLGLSNAELIQMATLDNARILGISSVTGSLEVGKVADFMVLEKNPLEKIKHLYKPNKVIARGMLIDKPKFKVFKHV